MVLNWVVSPPTPPEPLAIPGEAFLVVRTWEMLLASMGKAGNDAKHPTEHRKAPRIKTYWGPNTSSARMQKPGSSVYQFYTIISFNPSTKHVGFFNTLFHVFQMRKAKLSFGQGWLDQSLRAW